MGRLFSITVVLLLVSVFVTAGPVAYADDGSRSAPDWWQEHGPWWNWIDWELELPGVEVHVLEGYPCCPGYLEPNWGQLTREQARQALGLIAQAMQVYEERENLRKRQEREESIARSGQARSRAQQELDQAKQALRREWQERWALQAEDLTRIRQEKSLAGQAHSQAKKAVERAVLSNEPDAEVDRLYQERNQALQAWEQATLRERQELHRLEKQGWRDSGELTRALHQLEIDWYDQHRRVQDQRLQAREQREAREREKNKARAAMWMQNLCRARAAADGKSEEAASCHRLTPENLFGL